MLLEDKREKRRDNSKPTVHFGVYLVFGFFSMMFFIVSALSLYYNGTLPFSLPEFVDPDDSYHIFRRRLSEECYPEAYNSEINVI